MEALEFKTMRQNVIHGLPDITKIENYDPYTELGVAIIIQAIKDYRHALRMGYKTVIRECENFFKSPLFDVYANGAIDGQVIIDEAKRRNEYGSYISK